MFGSVTLEVAIGLVFVYFIISLLCSTLTEWISRMIAMRAKTLKDGINKLLQDDDSLKDIIFNHPLVQGLSPKKKNWWEFFNKDKPSPSNLPARTFALVLFDTLRRKGENNDEKGKSLEETSRQVVWNLEEGIDKWGNDNTKQVLSALLNSAKTHVDKWENAVAEFQASIEQWFDDSMDRVSGWYKRKAQVIVLIWAIVICLGLNIDTFVIANNLFQDTALRTSIAAAAEARVQQSISEGNASELKVIELRDQLSGLGLPIGWSGEAGDPRKLPDNFGGWVIKLVGVLITVFAASLGAPFWFDLLNKIVNLRASGKKPDKTEETTAAGGGKLPIPA